MAKFERQQNKILYAILNNDGTLFKDKHGDYKIYKDLNNLKDNIKKFENTKIGIFELKEVRENNE